MEEASVNQAWTEVEKLAQDGNVTVIRWVRAPGVNLLNEFVPGSTRRSTYD